MTFLAGLLLNCNWAIVSDITLYIVIPRYTDIPYCNASSPWPTAVAGEADSVSSVSATACNMGGPIYVSPGEPGESRLEYISF